VNTSSQVRKFSVAT